MNQSARYSSRGQFLRHRPLCPFRGIATSKIQYPTHLADRRALHDITYLCDAFLAPIPEESTDGTSGTDPRRPSTDAHLAGRRSGVDHCRRVQGQAALRRALRREHRQREHPPGVPPRRELLLLLVRSPRAYAEPRRTDTGGHVHRRASAQALWARGQRLRRRSASSSTWPPYGCCSTGS